MSEPGAGGQPQTGPGLAHWEVARGGAGGKSLPAASGQTEFCRPLVCSSMGVQEGREEAWADGSWEMLRETGATDFQQVIGEGGKAEKNGGNASHVMSYL